MLLLAHFTDGMQRGKATCPKSHSTGRFVTTRMKLEGIVPSETSQVQKNNILSDLTYTWGLKSQTRRKWRIEWRLPGAEGWGEWGDGG